MMAPRSLVTRVLNRLLGKRFLRWYVNTHFDDRRRLAIRNCIECEAHREFFLKGLSDSIQERNHPGVFFGHGKTRYEHYRDISIG